MFLLPGISLVVVGFKSDVEIINNRNEIITEKSFKQSMYETIDALPTGVMGKLAVIFRKS